MNKLDKNDKELVRFIYYKPQSMMRFLSRHGVLLPTNPTRQQILDKTFENLDKKEFVNKLNEMLNANRDENNSNLVGVTIMAGIAVASLITTAVQKSAKRRSDERQAEATLYAEELASYEAAQNQKAAAMNEQVAESADDYRGALLEESTKRQKNAVYIMGAVGVVLLVVLFTKKYWSRG
jgi:predicted nucleic acid-binding Zn ribbon protein